MIIILLVIKIISLRRNDCEVLIVRLNSASEFKEIVRICLRVKKLSIICSHDYFSPMDNYWVVHFHSLRGIRDSYR